MADLARAEAWYAAAFGLQREFATRIDAVDLDIVMLRDTEHGHRVELLHRPGSGPGLRTAKTTLAAVAAQCAQLRMLRYLVDGGPHVVATLSAMRADQRAGR